jgi:hypothetical protein
MKKLVLVFIVLVLITNSNAQNLDYSFIRTEGMYHYSKYDVEDSYRFPSTLHISDILETDSGKWLYATPYAYEITQESPVLVDSKTSFIGDSIFVDIEGNTSIFTSRGKTLFFKPFKHQDDEWIVYTDENGNYLKAHYWDHVWFTPYVSLMPGVIDSITKLYLNVYDSNHTLIDDSPLNTDIYLSRQYGPGKLPMVNDIDDLANTNYRLYDIIGIEKEGFINGFNLEEYYKSIVNSLVIGNEVHFYFEERLTEEFHYRIKRVINKNIADDIVTYTFEICDSIRNQDSIYHFTETEKYFLSMEPYQLLPGGLISESPTYLLFRNFFNTNWQNKSYMQYYSYLNYNDTLEMDGRYFLKFRNLSDLGNYSDPEYQFIENIGEICIENFVEYHPDFIVYYKTPTETWGTPFKHYCYDNTGISETQKTQITLYPNPAEDILYIESPHNIELIQVYDLQGRLILTDELIGRTSIDITNIKCGVYLIELYQLNKIVSHQKIIIK